MALLDKMAGGEAADPEAYLSLRGAGVCAVQPLSSFLARCRRLRGADFLSFFFYPDGMALSFFAEASVSRWDGCVALCRGPSIQTEWLCRSLQRPQYPDGMPVSRWDGSVVLCRGPQYSSFPARCRRLRGADSFSFFSYPDGMALSCFAKAPISRWDGSVVLCRGPSIQMG